MTKETAVVQAEPAEVVQVSETVSLISVIERAAFDERADVDKMVRLFELHERIQNREAEVAFNQALADMQLELPIITENGEIKTRGGQVQSKYALWEDIDEAIKPVLHKFGFSLGFKTDTTENTIKVTAVLRHRQGHKEETSITMPPDTSGSKNAVQAFASSVSYGKRYTGTALLNITSRGEDDDGMAAGGGKPETSNEWRGPKGKMQLRGALNELDKILQNACDMEAVIDAVKAYKPDMEQMKIDMPQIYNGGGDVPSIDQRIKNAKYRARLVTQCRNDFAESPTLEQLQYVFKEHQKDINGLPNLQKNEVIRAKDERKAELEKERNMA